VFKYGESIEPLEMTEELRDGYCFFFIEADRESEGLGILKFLYGKLVLVNADNSLE
jgi:hypothetical protein